MIEKLPFFEGFSEPGKAIVNVALLEQWLRENPLFELMTEQDESEGIPFKNRQGEDFL